MRKEWDQISVIRVQKSNQANISVNQVFEILSYNQLKLFL